MFDAGARTLENGFAATLRGVSVGVMDEALRPLPDPVAEGSLDEDVIRAWSEAMTAHRQLTGGELKAEAAAVRNYVGFVAEIGDGQASNQLLMRLCWQDPHAPRPHKFCAIEFATDGAIEVRHVKEPADFRSDALKKHMDMETDNRVFDSEAQRNAYLAFRKMHLLRERGSWAQIELVAVHGAPHLLVTEQYRDFRERAHDGGSAENSFAWDMGLLAGLHIVEDVQSSDAHRTMTQQIYEIASSAECDAPPGTARRRVLRQAEASALRAMVQREPILETREREARDEAASLFERAMMAANDVAFSMGSDYMAERPTDSTIRLRVSLGVDETRRLRKMITPQNSEVHRPDLVIALRETSPLAPRWVATPYVISPNGDIERKADVNFNHSDFASEEDALRHIAGYLAARTSPHPEGGDKEPTDEQWRASNALCSVHEVMDRHARLASAPPVSIVLDTRNQCLLGVHNKGSWVGRRRAQVQTYCIENTGHAAEPDDPDASFSIESSECGGDHYTTLLKAIQIGGAIATCARCKAFAVEEAQDCTLDESVAP